MGKAGRVISDQARELFDTDAYAYNEVGIMAAMESDTLLLLGPGLVKS